MLPTNWKPKALALGLLILIPVTSALLIWDQLKIESAAPSQTAGHDEWLALATMTRPHLKEGDILRIVPAWDATARVALRGAVPGSETWPFSALDWRSPADPLPWMSFERIVRLGWRDRVHADLDEYSFGGEEPSLLGETQKLIAIAEPLPPSPLRWRALDHLPQATVERTLKNGEIQTCTWSRDHHRCPGNTKWWQEIRNLRVDVGDLPRECVFVQPHPDGSRAEITFHRIDLNPGDTILLRAGNTIQGTRQDKGSDISMELRVDDIIVFRERYHKNDYLFIPWAVRFPTDASPDRYRITVSISAAKTSWRQSCFDLHVLATGWEKWGDVGYGAAFKEYPSPVPVRWFSWPAQILTERTDSQ